FACSIMVDHVHIVSLRHRQFIEQIVGFLKRAASRRFGELDLHPLKEYRNPRGRVPTPWVEGGWNRYLNDWQAIADAVHYVEQNPVKVGLPPQRWEFVRDWREAAPASFRPV